MKLDTTKDKDYDIACALRGPDAGGPLKLFLTYPIRWFVGVRTTGDLRVLMQSPLETIGTWNSYDPTTKAFVRKLLTRETHFATHALAGLRALEAKKVKGVTEFITWANRELGL